MTIQKEQKDDIKILNYYESDALKTMISDRKRYSFCMKSKVVRR